MRPDRPRARLAGLGASGAGLVAILGCSPQAQPPAGVDPGSRPETAAPPEVSADADWIEHTLRGSGGAFDDVLARAEERRLQILVTEVIRREGTVRLVEHGYRVGAEYVYPASAIKTFASVAALLELQRYQALGMEVDVDSPWQICPDDGAPCEEADPSNLAGERITMRHEIRKMQLVSDNTAFNRLYDFAGHDRVNSIPWALGFPDLRIQHRMYGATDAESRRTSPRMVLESRGGGPLVIPRRVSELELSAPAVRGLSIGRAHIDPETGERVEAPLDFSEKNYASIRDLHRLTLALTVPEADGVPALGLSPAHRELLVAAMTEDPLESANPRYEDPMRAGARYKTLMTGLVRVLPRARIRYVGKSGRAYGFHLDNAYVEDVHTGRAFVVTTVIYANSNGVLNDDEYEYDEVTRPYLHDLGEALGRAILTSPRPASSEG